MTDGVAVSKPTTSSMPPSSGSAMLGAPVARYFDREACRAACRPSEKTRSADASHALRPISRVFLEQLEGAGIRDRTVAELGCGTGALSLELLRSGASSVTAVDLSPQSIDLARRRSAAGGFGTRARFEVGDGATAGLDQHDVVISEKVFCCYPDARSLLANSLQAARLVYGVLLPESRGPWGAVSRLAIGFENFGRWILRDPFRAYVHDFRDIDAAVVAAGFQLRTQIHRGGWLLAVYCRP